MASIDRRPNGKYRAQIRRAGFKDKSKTFATKAAAERWARSIEAGMDKGTDVDIAELRKGTVNDLLDRFLRDEVAARKGGDWERKRIDFWKANADFVHQRLDQHLVDGIRRYFAKREKKVSPATVNRDMSLLSGIFRIAIRKWGVALQANPVHLVARPAVKTSGPGRVWVDDDLKALRDAAAAQGYCVDGSRLQVTHDYVLPAVELGIETAMRIGEICSVEAKDVDLVKRQLMLDETKNGDWRCVPLSTRAVEILKPLLAAAAAREAALPDRKLRLGDKAQRLGHIIPMTKGVLGLRYRQLRADAGLGRIRFHDTRHTAATRASKKLSNVMELAAFTGHRSLQSLKRYYHPDAQDLAAKLG